MPFTSFQRAALVLTSLGVSALTGCCQLQSVANSVSHWGEVRASCDLPETCNDGCLDPCVTLEPPEGYLADGSTFVGDRITGPPGKNAIDRLVELDEEIKGLRDENKSLHDELDLAKQTIQDQARAIDTASREMQRALSDYAQMRERLDKWYDELDSLTGQVQSAYDVQQQQLNQFEMELELVLSQCEPLLSGAPLRAVPSEAAAPNGTAPALPQPNDEAFDDPEEQGTETLLLPEPSEEAIGDRDDSADEDETQAARLGEAELGIGQVQRGRFRVQPAYRSAARERRASSNELPSSLTDLPLVAPSGRNAHDYQPRSAGRTDPPEPRRRF